MTNAERELFELYRQAANVLGPAPHVFDDDNLVAAWLGGLLSEKEHDDVLNHLAICSTCRQSAAALHQPVTLAEPAKAKANSNAKWITLFVLAASVLVMVGLAIPYLMRNKERPDPFVQVDQALEERRWNDAAEAAIAIAPEVLNDEERNQRRVKIQLASFHYSQEALTAGQVSDVQAAYDRAEKAGVLSEQLENLKWQAARGSKTSIELADNGYLIDYGIQLTGRSGRPMPPIPQPAIEQGFIAAIAKYPNSEILTVNYAQYLFKHRRYPEALTLFDKLQNQAPPPYNLLGEMGRGLTLFQTDKYEEALAAFQAVIVAHPDHPEWLEAYVNKAICLEALGKKDEAAAVWEDVLKRKPNAALKSRIKAHLKNR